MPKGDAMSSSGFSIGTTWATRICKEKNFISRIPVQPHGTRTNMHDTGPYQVYSIGASHINALHSVTLSDITRTPVVIKTAALPGTGGESAFRPKPQSLSRTGAVTSQDDVITATCN